MKVYTKKARSAAAFSNMRGVTDFSNAAQFNLYEKGYSHLFVINGPEYIRMLAEGGDTELKELYNTFLYIIEYEFKGLDGIQDIDVENIDVTDNISTLSVIGKVNKQSASEISMNYTEKSGSTITRFIKYYLEGIKDPRTQAKTYHGLIKQGKLAAGFENEVFNLMYIVTDNTMLQVEKAYLLCNAWPNKAQTSIYESEKGTIEKADIQVTWQCFVIDGAIIDKYAVQILAATNEDGAVKGAYSTTQTEGSEVIQIADTFNGKDVNEPMSGIANSASFDPTIHLDSTGEDDTVSFTYHVAKDRDTSDNEGDYPLFDYFNSTTSGGENVATGTASNV